MTADLANNHSPIAQRVERKARRIAAESQTQPTDDDLEMGLAQEIALAVELVDQTRRLYAVLRESLFDDELRIETDLAIVKNEYPVYSADEATLRARLLSLEKERRRLALQETDSLRQLYSELLSLLQRYRQLGPPDENR